MKKIVLLISAAMLATACAGKKKTHNHAMLEKYPACYHQNLKIEAKCIEKNEAGQKTSALELENAAYPGQYK